MCFVLKCWTGDHVLACFLVGACCIINGMGGLCLLASVCKVQGHYPAGRGKDGKCSDTKLALLTVGPSTLG